MYLEAIRTLSPLLCFSLCELPSSSLQTGFLHQAGSMAAEN